MAEAPPQLYQRKLDPCARVNGNREPKEREKKQTQQQQQQQATLATKQQQEQRQNSTVSILRLKQRADL